MYLASNLKYLRSENSISQADLAEILKTTRSNIGAYEEDRCEPSFCVINQIAKYFRVDIVDLVFSDLSKKKRVAMKDPAVKLYQLYIKQPIKIKKAIDSLLGI